MSFLKIWPTVVLASFLFAQMVLFGQQNQAVDLEAIHEAHRHLYSQPGPSLRQKLIESGANNLGIDSVADEGGEPNQSLHEPERFDADVCKASAIVVGSPTSLKGLLSSNEALVFTDYQVRIDEVIKNTADLALAPKRTIVLARPGGTAKISEGVIIMQDHEFGNLRSGLEYLLFLQSIPGEQQGFESLDDVNTFLVQSGHLKAVGSQNRSSLREAFLSGVSLAQLKEKTTMSLASCK